MISRTMWFGTLVTLTLAGFAWGQIPNAGFESWTNNAPDGWVTSNAAPLYTNVTQSSTAHSGSFAIRGDVAVVSPVTIPATIQSGPGGHGFAYSQRPAAVTGWYQFNSVGSDRFGVNVALYKGGESGTVVALAASADATTRGSYTQFSVPFNYLTSDTPDLCIMQFLIALPFGGSAVHAGTYFLLDDLALGGTSDVAEPSARPIQYQLDQNYPNPFNPSTTIRFGLPHQSYVRLVVFNALGQEVASLASEEMSAGYHAVRFDGSRLSSGVYFYRIQAGNFSATRQLMLLK